MLRRRLLLLTAVLLATGVIAAALTPRELREGEQAPTTAVPAPPPRATPGGPPRVPQRTVTVDAEAPRRAVVRVRQGTLLRLAVRAPEPDEVELVGLGRFEPVDRFSPARFEFFADRPGTFPIRLREAERTVGRLVVERRPL